MQFRLFRRSAATGLRTRHNGAVQAPQQPGAATEPAPFAGLYPYQPFTIDEIRAYIDRLRGEARDDEFQARELYDLHLRKLAKADDYERLLTLVAEDAARSAPVRSGPAMCTDELLEYQPHPERQHLANGVQPGFEPWQPQLPDTLTMPAVNGAAR